LAGSPRPYVRILFDRQWIERQAPDAGNVRLGKFLKDERFYHIDPHPLFSARYYLQRFPDVAAAKISPFQHYIEHGWREGRDPHPYFTNDWYLEQNPDVLHAGQNPLIHYLEHGWREGRRPNPVFDPLAYLNRHPDVEAAGIEPLTHFVMYGLAEGRDIPFQNLERDWRSLVAATDSPTLMDHLLSETPRLPAAVQMEEAPADSAWPPKPLNDHWMPQALRNFMIERGWEDQIPLFSYLYSVMDAYADAPEDFASSHACRLIVERARKLSAERATRPADLCSASIIIPVYNNVLDTLLCLVSLLEMKPSSSFEILVADDCSSDSTPLLMAEIGGVVRHIRNAENLGFVNNCNAAAQLAAGQSIVLLNNDTLVLPGWLDHLLTPLKRFEDVGLVGSKLINWDGTLQEAGGIAWKDGSAWNFGRGRNPVEPEFNYLRDVDYCSGASLALRADLWRELHGFDADFSPAYCEDSDLAFRVRDAGLRTIYSPRSELIHHEGRSHGRDTTAGIKGYQIANQKRLFERWKSVLEREHFANGENLLWARDRSATKPHILVIDHYVPQHDKDAGSRTMFQFLEVLLDAGWAVTFWPENLYYDPEYTKTIQEIGVEVIYGLPFVGKFSDFLRQRKGLYDAVLLSRPHVAANFIDDVRTLTDARVLYYGHDVHFERMKAQREITGSTLEENDVEAMRVLELGLCDRCDVVLYPSEEEARLMQGLVDPGVQSVSVPAYRYSDEDLLVGEQAAANVAPSDGSRVQLLFVGGFSHGPNGDGVRWFCREVAPILRSEGFSFDLKIAGSNPTADVWELESDDVHVLGFVPDEELRDLYRAATVVIAPLRFGAGVKGKVIEAMAAGVPVVTTRVGAQGLRAADEFLFLGDTPEQFVAALRAAVRDENARAKAERALKYVRTHYSQAAMTRVFEQVLASCHFVSKAA
jgi:GT2 family glycosyltransferase